MVCFDIFIKFVYNFDINSKFQNFTSDFVWKIQSIDFQRIVSAKNKRICLFIIWFIGKSYAISTVLNISFFMVLSLILQNSRSFEFFIQNRGLNCESFNLNLYQIYFNFLKMFHILHFSYFFLL